MVFLRLTFKALKTYLQLASVSENGYEIETFEGIVTLKVDNAGNFVVEVKKA